MKRLALPWAALACLLLLPATGPAQTRSFALLQDSLERIESADLLRVRRAQLLGADEDAAPEIAIERGLLTLRIYQLTGDEAELDRAREIFERAAARPATAAWGHYGRARVLLERAALDEQKGGFVLGTVFARALGMDPRTQAREALRRALQLDPSLAEAAALLADRAAESGNIGELRDARDALRRTWNAGGRAFAVALALAHVELTLGDLQAAAAAADTALALAHLPGGDSAAALHARALTSLLQPGHERLGSEAYFAGAERLSPAAAARYYNDILPILPDAERDAWESTPLPDRGDWLRRFWTQRAADAGIPLPDLLAEHYRRLLHARRNYPRNHRLGAPPEGALRTTAEAHALPYDDRGIITLRYGRPDQVVRTTIRGLRPNETWVYFNDDDSAPLMFHFVALRGAHDYYLVEDIVQALDFTLPLKPAEFSEAVVRLLEDRARFDQRYKFAALRFQSAAQRNFTLSMGDVRRAIQEIEAEHRARTLAALSGESYGPRFAEELPFHYDLFTLRGADGLTEVTAAIAVPADALEPRREAGRNVYALRLTLTLFDPGTGTAASADTLLQFGSSEPVRAGAYVRSHLRLDVQPNPNARYRLTVVNPNAESTGRSYAGRFSVPDYGNPDQLMISDVVLSAPDTAGAWIRGNARLALVPPRFFPRSQPFTLFYEVYNLPEGAPYRTEILIEPVQGGGLLRRILPLGSRNRIRLEFEGHARLAAPGTVQELRRISGDVRPGRYRVRITVTDLAADRSATREKEFVIYD